jgi:hypothetical protein
MDIGANVNYGGLNVTGYYYAGNGMLNLTDYGLTSDDKHRDSDGGYVQATYELPIKTKVGASWGYRS